MTADVLASLAATSVLDPADGLVAVVLGVVSFVVAVGAILVAVRLYREGTRRRQALMRGALGGSFVVAAVLAWNTKEAFPVALMITYVWWVALIDVVALVVIALQRRQHGSSA